MADAYGVATREGYHIGGVKVFGGKGVEDGGGVA